MAGVVVAVIAIGVMAAIAVVAAVFSYISCLI